MIIYFLGLLAAFGIGFILGEAGVRVHAWSYIRSIRVHGYGEDIDSETVEDIGNVFNDTPDPEDKKAPSRGFFS